MDDDLRAPHADYKQTLGCDRDFMLLDCVTLRQNARAGGPAPCLRGRTFELVHCDWIDKRRPVASESFADGDCSQRRVRRPYARTDISAVYREGAGLYARFPKSKMDILDLWIGRRGPTLDDRQTLSAEWLSADWVAGSGRRAGRNDNSESIGAKNANTGLRANTGRGDARWLTLTGLTLTIPVNERNGDVSTVL